MCARPRVWLTFAAMREPYERRFTSVKGASGVRKPYAFDRNDETAWLRPSSGRISRLVRSAGRGWNCCRDKAATFKPAVSRVISRSPFRKRCGCAPSPNAPPTRHQGTLHPPDNAFQRSTRTSSSCKKSRSPGRESAPLKRAAVARRNRMSALGANERNARVSAGGGNRCR